MKRGDLIAERYELENGLGRGGMAEVWCARDVRLDRQVAVKFLASEFAEDPEFLVRFFTEAQSVASLNHPNVVSVLDFGDFEGSSYLVMEYVPGGSLVDITGEPLMPERALELVEQAARGAGAAHDIGVVHRDIKPANVLLDDEGRPKLADFGIASATGRERMTATGETIGSPHYISPEQISGAGATPASDVYSLGIVLYELLTGVRPHEHDNLTAVAIAHVDSEPEPPSAHVDDLDPALDALVLRCLAKDPEDRFADGNELAECIASEDYRHDATAFMPATSTGDESSDRRPRRALLIGAAALGIATIALAGVLTLGSNDDAPASGDQNGSATQEGNKKAKPTPSVDPSTGEVVTPPAEPSTAPTEPASEEADPSDDDPATGDDEDAPEDDPEPEPDPDPTEEPEPTPEPEPTEEATPAP
ncbi:MAG: serine/threonine-protein kinase [Actinomycetota bacterium]